MPVSMVVLIMILVAVFTLVCISDYVVLEMVLFFNTSTMTMGFSVNTYSYLFLLIIILISVMVMFWSDFYMDLNSSLVYFYVVLFIFIISMLILVLSSSLLVVLLGWEGLGVSSYVLILFYQNWMSSNGGMVTLLTNRLGDSIMMVVFSYFLLLVEVGMMVKISFFMILSLNLLTLTKSAQLPFSSWLPLAMAAPTPVSALVHSSTLVTAGVWLLIRFNQNVHMMSGFLLVLGVATSLVASIAALNEKDGKKIVALSTLSQLGLMFMSLFYGGKFLCLFHVLIHAVAKANLFLVIGSLIHLRFSQQSVRHMSMGTMNALCMFSLFVSLASLSGLLLFSGFFSKETIFSSNYFLVNSVFTIMVLIASMAFTVSYCTLLFNLVSVAMKESILYKKESSISMVFSMVLLMLLSTGLGSFFLNEYLYWCVCSFSLVGVYWSILMISIVFNNKLKLMNTYMISLMVLIKVLTNSFLIKSKSVSSKSSESFFENMFLLSSVSVSSLTHYLNVYFLTSISILILILY